MRPAAPALIRTSAFRQWKWAATRPISSWFALPSTGGDFRLATQVPSEVCSSADDRALGFTLTLRLRVLTVSTAPLL